MVDIMLCVLLGAASLLVLSAAMLLSLLSYEYYKEQQLLRKYHDGR